MGWVGGVSFRHAAWIIFSSRLCPALMPDLEWFFFHDHQYGNLHQNFVISSRRRRPRPGVKEGNNSEGMEVSLGGRGVGGGGDLISEELWVCRQALSPDGRFLLGLRSRRFLRGAATPQEDRRVGKKRSVWRWRHTLTNIYADTHTRQSP